MKNKIELGVYYFKERNLQEYFIEVLRLCIYSRNNNRTKKRNKKEKRSKSHIQRSIINVFFKYSENIYNTIKYGGNTNGRREELTDRPSS